MAINLIFVTLSLFASSPQEHPAKFGHVLVYSPCLFGKRIVVHARQTCKQQFLKQNIFETRTPIDKSCMLLLNLWINPVACCCCFICWCWSLFRIFTSEIECVKPRFGKVCKMGNGTINNKAMKYCLLNCLDMLRNGSDFSQFHCMH